MRVIDLLGELGFYRQQEALLKKWMSENLRIPELDVQDPMATAITVMANAKEIVKATLPLLSTVATNVLRTLRQAGLVDEQR